MTEAAQNGLDHAAFRAPERNGHVISGVTPRFGLVQEQRKDGTEQLVRAAFLDVTVDGEKTSIQEPLRDHTPGEIIRAVVDMYARVDPRIEELVKKPRSFIDSPPFGRYVFPVTLGNNGTSAHGWAQHEKKDMAIALATIDGIKNYLNPKPASK